MLSTCLMKPSKS